MNQPDYDSDDECICGSDAAALGYCKEQYTVLTLSQIAELLEQESSEEESESEEVENKKTI